MRKIFIFMIFLALWIPSAASAFYGKTDFSGGTLASGLLNGDTTGATFTVTSDVNSAAFPTTNFLVIIWTAPPTCPAPHTCANREIVLVSSRSGNTFTIGSRNYFGTTHSGDWAAGSRVTHSILAENLQEYESLTPQLVRLGLGQAADSSAVMAATGQYFSAKFMTTTALNWNNGNVQYFALASGSQTFTFSNPKDGGRYALILKQPASGSAGTVVWPGTVIWSGGTMPSLTATNGKVDIVTFIYDATNGMYYAGFSQNY